MTVLAPKILRIDGSTRQSDSVSRSLTDLAVATLQDIAGVSNIAQRDTRSGIGNISNAWRNASLTRMRPARLKTVRSSPSLKH